MTYGQLLSSPLSSFNGPLLVLLSEPRQIIGRWSRPLLCLPCSLGQEKWSILNHGKASWIDAGDGAHGNPFTDLSCGFDSGTLVIALPNVKIHLRSCTAAHVSGACT